MVSLPSIEMIRITWNVRKFFRAKNVSNSAPVPLLSLFYDSFPIFLISLMNKYVANVLDSKEVIQSKCSLDKIQQIVTQFHCNLSNKQRPKPR